MTDQKDRHPEAPGEANRNKHINFLATENDAADENYDADDAGDNVSGDDNGFFTDDDNQLQTKEEHETDKSNYPPKNEKITPLEPGITTSTLGDKITVNPNNEDLVTLVKDDDASPYINEDDQAH